jgi:hypothetical protein
MRGLNSMPTYQVLDHLDCRLGFIARRIVTLAGDVCAECADELGWLAKEAADLRAAVELLRDRERFSKRKEAKSAADAK